MKPLSFISSAFLIFTLSLFAYGPSLKGNLDISNQRIVFLKGAEVGAAYLTIAQTAPEPDRLIGAKLNSTNREEEKTLFTRLISLFSKFSENQPTIELHDHVPLPGKPGVLTMKHIKEGLEIPASTQDKNRNMHPGLVSFEPQGKHLMLYHFPKEIRDSKEVEIILTFEKAGDITVSFPINPPSSAKDKPCSCDHNH